MLWHSITRPAYDTYEEPFIDVPDGDTGWFEITYAKRRGILEDEGRFYPDSVLTTESALLWLYRTRNVAELPDMQPQHLSQLQSDFPLSDTEDALSPVSQSQLEQWMNELDTFLTDRVQQVSFTPKTSMD